jgi:HlyD family secretion protein
MTAEIRIIVDDRQEDVLQIPVQSVLSIANRFFAYVAVNGEIERREIKVGDANDEYMEILDGIAEGERVVMNPRTHFSREINELEVRLLGEQEDNRERTRVPERPAGAAPGKPAAGGPPAAGAAQSGGGPGGAGGGPGGGGGRPSPEAIITQLDKNKDGVVTKDESDMRGRFDQVDADGDGKITVEELKKSFASR